MPPNSSIYVLKFVLKKFGKHLCYVPTIPTVNGIHDDEKTKALTKINSTQQKHQQKIDWIYF